MCQLPTLSRTRLCSVSSTGWMCIQPTPFNTVTMAVKRATDGRYYVNIASVMRSEDVVIRCDPCLDAMRNSDRNRWRD